MEIVILFLVNSGGKMFCLFCDTAIVTVKKFNAQQQYDLHKDYKYAKLEENIGEDEEEEEREEEEEEEREEEEEEEEEEERQCLLMLCFEEKEEKAKHGQNEKAKN
ncbi:Hypothetical predicted protein [Octopus vulgaris]|uniref:Uncharacterized protein n=1 Tax=Octopus vulgaris TaxID=6645 RepID=A0AA36B547_OCTVU|nr:Hypothetical predicted protein [Octopus vulgaris]